MKKGYLVITLLLSLTLSALSLTTETKRDPFQPPATPKRKKGSIKSVSFYEFKLRGIIAKHSALIEAENMSFIVTVGSEIGFESVKVLSIEEDHVQVKLETKQWKWSI